MTPEITLSDIDQSVNYQQAQQITTLNHADYKPQEAYYSYQTAPWTVEAIEHGNGEKHGHSFSVPWAPQADVPLDPTLDSMHPQRPCSQSVIVADKVSPSEFGFDAWPEEADFLFPLGTTSTNSYKPFHSDAPTYTHPFPVPMSRDDMPVLGVTSAMLRGKVPQSAQAIQSYKPAVPAYGLRFADQSSALFAAEPLRHWCPPAPDSSIPSTDAERHHWVLKLVDAINNITDVLDATSPNFNKRWISSTPYYSHSAKEIVAWNVLSFAELLHTKGPAALSSFDPISCKNAAKTRTCTFAERMDDIVRLLTFSKARCEKLLAGLGTQMVVGNPDTLLRMTKGNNLQNKKRQAVLEAGREVKKFKTI